jgi:hypothetical protein
MVAELERHRRGRDRTDEELALPADIEELHPEGRRCGEAREDDRRREHERRAEAAARQERRVEQLAVGLAGIVAGRRQHDCHGGECAGERSDRDGKHEPARLHQPPLDAH